MKFFTIKSLVIFLCAAAAIGFLVGAAKGAMEEHHASATCVQNGGMLFKSTKYYACIDLYLDHPLGK